MNNKYFGLLAPVLVLAVCMSFSFAAAAEVTKTLISVNNMEKRMDFTLDIIDSDRNEILQTFEGKSDGAGIYIHKSSGGVPGYYSFGVSNLKLVFKIDNNGEMTKKEFGPYPVGIDIIIEFNAGSADEVPADSATVSDDASIGETSTVDESSSGSITGQAIDSQQAKNRPSNLFFYILGAIVLFGAAALLVLRSSFRGQRQSLVPVVPLSAESKQKSMTPQNKYNLMMAQKRIRELESEVSRLKNQEKIDQIERNIAQEKSEIDKLRKGRI